MKVVKVLLIFLAVFSFSQGNEWFTDFNEALRRAESEGKLILLYFYSEHCPYCHQVEEFVLGDEDVERVLENNFIVVGVDTLENPELMEEFSVFGVPSFVVYEPRASKVLGTFFGSLPREDFLSLLLKACNKSSIRRC